MRRRPQALLKRAAPGRETSSRTWSSCRSLRWWRAGPRRADHARDRRRHRHHRAVLRGAGVGSVGSLNAISETLTAAIPLVLAGLGLALGFRAGLFNIGAEGQILMGGMAAAIFSASASRAAVRAFVLMPLCWRARWSARSTPPSPGAEGDDRRA
jgi:hypothetical protein